MEGGGGSEGGEREEEKTGWKKSSGRGRTRRGGVVRQLKDTQTL